MRESDDPQPIQRVRIRAWGRVQGVGFRMSARAEGRTLGIDVEARNLEDGTVMIEAYGPDDAIEEFIAWSRTGPPAAEVESFDVEVLADEDDPYTGA